ncbi:MAG TPA: glycosyltransferase [Jatrophihabitantaceae bacterium]|nr:glycosyltransferase [Jatrophihabitantaceae bacterium]
MVALKPGQLKSYARRAKLAVEFERIAHARRARIDENAVFYESFGGNGMLCNPEAIFRALLAADDMSHLRHTWAFTDLDEYAETIREFEKNPRVSFVRSGSYAYYVALSRSKYLVNNATFPAQFGKRDGQVYLNTWHGTPLKAMGYEVPGAALLTRNVVRNLLSADYLLAPNDTTSEMYLSAFRMRNIYQGAILDVGSPRVDRQTIGDDEKQDFRTQLRQRGVAVDDREIILYAPTWHGSFYAPINDIQQLRARVDTISSQIDSSRYRLLLKVHQQVYKHAKDLRDIHEILVPNDLPTNKVLAITDVLITDYSSIFIDFLPTGRPVLFFAPDIGDYRNTRGLNLPVDQWPGPVTGDLDELISNVKNLHTGTDQDPVMAYAERYAAARERYCTRETGSAANDVIDIVFRGRAAGPNVRRNFSDGRTSLLMHVGGLLENGITASALCLLDNIDYSKYDVSVTFPLGSSTNRAHMVDRINRNVRLLPRFGGTNGSKVQVTSMLAVKMRTRRQHERSLSRHAALLRDEWVRCFGAARFDHVIDFSGYAPFWVKLLASRNGGSFSVWMHTDIRSEVSNSGRSSWLRASLDGVSALYTHADRLVSVSPALCDVNRRRLAHYAPADRFTYARNTINYTRVLDMAYGAPAGESNAPPAGGAPTNAGLTETVDWLVSRFGATRVIAEMDRRSTLKTVLPTKPGVRTFVTAGRLSAEKNYWRLIRAFDQVHQAEPNTRLVILGAGVQLQSLQQLVEELSLTSAVTLAKHQANPYVVVANSDCFVMSSDYEGQPMVILEALILGLPIVTTAFDTVRGALPDGYGIVVRKSDDALAEGMREFLRGNVPAKPFDAAAYNREAMDEFYRAIGAA